MMFSTTGEMKHIFPLSLVLAAALVPAASVCLGDDQIHVYTVPKETPPPPPPLSGQGSASPDSMSSGQVPVGDVSPADVHWKTPNGWQELPPTSVRIGNFLIINADGKKAEVAITSFPGSVGTELDNVNRWRRELALPPMNEAGLSSEPIAVDRASGRLYDISGESGRTVVADVMRDGASWFFKLKGDKSVVASARSTFLDFLKSVQFGASQAASSSSVSMPVDSAAADSADNAKWNPPSHWRDRPAGPMVLKSYTVDDDKGTAVVSISSFPGDVGGKLANVNRWRGQLSLPPVSEEDFSTAIQSIDANGVQATLVDFTGTDAKTSQPARMVAAIVPHGGQTWFYKLVGDGATVSKEKDGFVKFVQTAQYQ